MNDTQVNGKQPQHYGDKSLVIDYKALQAPQLEDMMNDIEKLI